jgi:hypothetical protein
MALAAPTWPMLLWQSISAVEALSRTTVKRLSGFMTALRILST